jgi:hypothetical protein
MIAKKRNAIGWVRFSTLEQKKGKSKRRQVEIAEKVCKEKGWSLVKDIEATFDGVSAFHGKPILQFIEWVENCTIPEGIILIIEQFNRLDRNTPAKAFAHFYRLLELGIDVYVATLETLFTLEGINARDGRQMQMVTDAQRQASMDSDTKRGWAEAQWKMIRDDMAEWTKHLVPTSNVPYGFKTYKDPEGRVNRYGDLCDNIAIQHPDEAKVIKRIFRMSGKGFIPQQIADALNADGIKPRNAKAWGRTSICKILHSRVYCGEYQPLKRTSTNNREPDGDPIPNAFPLIITPKEFAEGHIVSHPRGKDNPNLRNTKDSNLFSFIGKCSECGNQVFSADSKVGWRSRCLGNRQHLCKVGSGIDRTFLEVSVVDVILKYLNPNITKPSDPKASKALEKRLDRITKDIQVLNEKIKTIVENLAEETDADLKAAYRQRFQDRKKELCDLQADENQTRLEMEKLSGFSKGLIERRNDIQDHAAQAILGIPGDIRLTEMEGLDLKTRQTSKIKVSTPWWTSLKPLPESERTEARKRLKAAICKVVSTIRIDLANRTFQVVLVDGKKLTRPTGVGKTSTDFPVFDAHTKPMTPEWDVVLGGIFLRWCASPMAPKRVQPKAMGLIAKLEADLIDDSAITLEEFWKIEKAKAEAKAKAQAKAKEKASRHKPRP